MTDHSSPSTVTDELAEGLAKQAIDRSLARLKQLHDYAGRPTWDAVLAEEIRRALASGHTALLREIGAERQRQIEAEGWTPEHDDTHANGGYDNGPALSQAAACYALGSPLRWPWDEEWWKPSDHRRNCVKAAALLVAEIERLDRAALSRALAGGEEAQEVSSGE